jgi:DNA-binding transcriptional MerR regulator
VFTIGEFSRITGLTVKALRFYHECGLLQPATVDPGSGYRYYAPAQVERARVIAQLRELDFTLEEIGALLAGEHDSPKLLERLEAKHKHLESLARHAHAQAAALRNLIRHEREMGEIMQTTMFEVEEKVLEPMLIAGVRLKGKYSECGQGFARVARALGRSLAGKCFLLHYDDDYAEEADYETCFPVRRAKPVDGISIRELPGGRCISLVHKGPYEQLSRSYARVAEYAKGKGYEIVRPTREIYLKGPGMIFRGNPNNYLTEIQMLIRTPAVA